MEDASPRHLCIERDRWRTIVGWLLDLKTTTNEALVAQIGKLNHALDEVELEIRGVERRLNDALYELYGVTDLERLRPRRMNKSIRFGSAGIDAITGT
jgi:hypothetical protein